MAYAVEQVIKFLEENKGKIEAGKAATIRKRAENANDGNGLFIGNKAEEIFDDAQLEAEFRNAAESMEYLEIGIRVMRARNRAVGKVVVA